MWKGKSWEDTYNRAYEIGVEKASVQWFMVLPNFYICHATKRRQKLAFWNHYRIFSVVMSGIVIQNRQDMTARKVHLQRYWEVCGGPHLKIQRLLECVIWFPWRAYRQGCAYQRKEDASKEEVLLPCQFCVCWKYCPKNSQSLFFATPAKVLSVLFHHANTYWLVAEGTFHIQIV